MTISDYLKKGVIDNPLNIKRVGGDLPTSQSSNKNIFILIAVAGAMALTFSTVWAYLNFYTGSASISAFIIVVVYTPIIAKTVSVTLLDESGNKKAFVDQMENEVSSLSTIWEVQNIRETNSNGVDIGFVDYIDGTRSILLRMVMGSVMNKPKSVIKSHYGSLESLLNFVDDLGYTKDMYVADESISDHQIMNFYYKSLNSVDDAKYVKVFSNMLDYIDLVTKIKGSVAVIYVVVNGWGAKKHLMFKELSSLPDKLGGDHLFVSVEIADRMAFDKFISNESSVTSFDIEELKLFKYRNTVNIGRSAVLEARNAKEEVTKVFNPKFEAKNNVSQRNLGKKNNTLTEASSQERLQQIKSQKVSKSSSPKIYQEVVGEEFAINSLPESETFLRIMQSGGEVTVGSNKPTSTDTGRDSEQTSGSED